MTERPILFRPTMAKATFEDLKTQTRRVVKPQPDKTHDGEPYWNIGGYRAWEFRGIQDVLRMGTVNPLACRYGKPGDRLSIRERMRVIRIRTLRQMQIRVRYEADGTESDWIDYPDRLQGRPEIGKCLAYGGFREASRTLLEIKDIRIERLQDISETDARAEGVEPTEVGNLTEIPESWIRKGWMPSLESVSYRAGFGVLWDKFNGKKFPWSSNPWLWVIEFRKI